jgi:DMATS type aromatic prenyltransferase
VSGPGAVEARATKTLGGLVTGQLLRLCQVSGIDEADAETYARVLTDALAGVAERSLDLPPPAWTFLSDDSTPVEFSLSFVPDGPPALRVLLEPGSGTASLRDNGRAGLAVVRSMADRWGFATGQLDLLEDLFLPDDPEGPLALWIALELRPGGVPKVKVYLNPAARGADRAAETVREALDRLGHRGAFDTLPPGDGYPFLALDLGDWQAPRVKVYVTHRELRVPDVGGLSRMGPGPDAEVLEGFLRQTGGYDDGTPGPEARFDRRPVLTCHSFTRTTGGPTGFTLHVPIRGYVPHDGVALDRATAVLARHGIDPAVLERALTAVTPRAPRDGRGLIAYVALAHERGRPPRVTTYLSSEAYEVLPPASPPPLQRAPSGTAREPVPGTSAIS